MKKQEKKILIFLLLLILIAIDYPFVDKALRNFFVDYEVGIVERAIDGDTIVVNGSNVRLLGINTPEKGEKYYEEAKSFLEENIKGELIKLKKNKEDKDLYGRKLRYIFLNDENVNLRLVKEGFANIYFPSGKDRYYPEFKEAWENCIINNNNLCEKSSDKCALCVKLAELSIDTQEITLSNSCNFSCNLEDWSIKDEGRKRFVFPKISLEDEITIKVGEGNNTKDLLFWKGEKYVWTKTGDSLFIRDSNGKLVLFHTY